MCWNVEPTNIIAYERAYVTFGDKKIKREYNNNKKNHHSTPPIPPPSLFFAGGSDDGRGGGGKGIKI